MSANRLRDKVIVITGGAHGIGAATVQRCSEEGARVVLVDIDRARGEAAAAKYGATYSATDVSDHAAVGALVTQTVHEFGQLDCVVSNACLHRYGSIENTSPEMWDRVIAVNLSATYHLAHHAAPHLRKQKGASMVIISSVQAVRGFHNSAAYAASKGGQLALMQQLAADLAPAIRVNAILPGTIRSYPESLDAEQEAYWSGIHALKRIGECVEVANGVVFLASDEASFITGHGLAIDGGMAMYGGR
jgi:NAD(P)-dependent dehydrogenase (short-subunit alcohol dehydrogenase family)